MERFKITGFTPPSTHTAKFLSQEPKSFHRHNESSQPKEPVMVRAGDEVIIDTDACHNRELFIGDVYDCDGAWVNHKNYSLEKMTFHVHTAISLA